MLLNIAVIRTHALVPAQSPSQVQYLQAHVLSVADVASSCNSQKNK